MGSRRSPGTHPVLLLFSLLASLPPAVPATSRSITILKSRDLAPYNLAVQGARRALTAWDPTIHFQEVNLPNSPAAERELLDGIQKLHPDLILTVGTQATRAVAGRIKTIPVVFSLVLASGGEEALIRRRGPNMTGAAMDVPIIEQFSRLRDVIPSLRRVGVVFNPRETGRVIEAAREAAATVGLQLIEMPVSSEAQVMKEIDLLKDRADVLWAVADSTVYTSRSVDYILLRTLRDAVPFVGLSPSFVKAGALLSFSCDYEDVGAQSGEVAAEILRGKPPAELPVVYPRHVSMYLNLNTARAIRLEISPEIQAGSQLYPEP